MTRLPRVNLFLATFLKLMFCSYSLNDIHYDIISAMDNLVCPIADRTLHVVMKSKVMCSMVCSTEPDCQTWVHEEQAQVCYTCRWMMNNASQMEPLPNGKFAQISGCGQPFDLVDGPNGVPDQFITASSTYTSEFMPYYAKFTSHGWVPGRFDTKQYLQVSFEVSGEKVVKSVCTMGLNRTIVYQYVTKYRLQYSLNCSTFNYITDSNGNPQVYTGNYDKNSVVCADLTPPMKMKCVRINPIDWNEYIALRFEAVGC